MQDKHKTLLETQESDKKVFAAHEDTFTDYASFEVYE